MFRNNGSRHSILQSPRAEKKAWERNLKAVLFLSLFKGIFFPSGKDPFVGLNVVFTMLYQELFLPFLCRNMEENILKFIFGLKVACISPD